MTKFFASDHREEIAVKRKFIAYYRVSTPKQGRSGLGLDAQRAAVAKSVADGPANIIAEFTEVESGRRNNRPALEEALTVARLHRATLVVAKVDRLTRLVGFLERLLEAGVDVRFADLPAIEGPTGRFMLQQMAAVAELEAGLISARTKAALAAAKARGQRLGGHRGGSLSSEARRRGRDSQSSLADRRAQDLGPVLKQLRAQGIASPTAIARALTARGIPTARGGTNWSGPQVRLIEARLARSGG
nr:recombinase family protein [Bradyrhizobium sp. 141]